MKLDKIILISGIALAVFLTLKSMKQFVYLSFTLLSLKIVWIALIVLFVLRAIKKRTQP